MRHHRSLIIFIMALSFLLLLAEQVSAQEFKYRVKLDQMMGSREGELIISPSGVTFETKHPKDHLFWAYKDIQFLEISIPTNVRIWSYEDQSRLMLGRDKRYSFKLTNTKFDEQVIEFLRNQSERPFLASFASSETSDQPIAEIAVKHLHRLGGCQGILKIYHDHVAFVTSDGHDARSWLWSDIGSISRSDQWRLDLVTYEPQMGGSNRSFNFILKERLSEEIYDQMWSKVYRPTPLSKPGKDIYTKP